MAALAGTAIAGDNDAASSAASKKQIKKLVKKQVAKSATTYVIRESAGPTTVTSGSVNNASVQCVGDETAVGGGPLWDDAATADTRVLQSIPNPSAGSAPTGWAVTGSNDTGTDKHLRARVVCASP